ncbi:MAG: hypothetical protein Kow0077_27490 [Anaerolineae bacterium]
MTGKRIKHALTYASTAGQGLVEYALILVLVAIVSIVVLAVLGTQVQETFCDVLLNLGSMAPDVEACEAPRVTCSGLSDGQVVSSPVYMEAIVSDNNGPSSIQRVDFYVDSTHIRTEYHYKYCLGGTDDCSTPQNISPGTHTIRAVATDADGYQGSCSVTVTVQ